MFRQTKDCPECGASIDKRASFCPQCGAAQEDAPAQKRCGSCGAMVPVTAKFCPNCRARMETVQAPRVGDNRWRRGEDDFATHIVVDDVRGFLARDLIVEPGTQAILLVDGANAGVVGPGKYQMDDLIERGAVSLNLRSAHRVEVILIDTADTELEFTVSGIYTADPLAVSVTCVVDVQVANPMRFFQTLMRSRRSYPVHELRDYLYGEVEDAAGEWLSAYHVEDLRTNLKVKQDLEAAIQAHLQGTEERNGLRFVRVRALDLAHPYFDRVTQQQAALFIASAEAEEAFRAERARINQERRERGLLMEEEVGKSEDALARRKALYAIYDEDQLQDLFEQERKVRMHEERAQLWERMRQSVLGDKMAEMRGEREMERFLREQDRDRLLEEKEWQELQQLIREEQEDHQGLRAHLLAKAQMERDYEMQQIEFLQRTDLKDAELAWEIQHAREELEGRQEIDRRRWEYELEKRARQAEFDRQQRKVEDVERRERELQDTQARLSIRMQEARTHAEIERIEREQDQADAELGMLLLERMKEIRRRDEMERDLHTFDMEQRRTNLQLDAEQRRMAIELERQRQEQAYELERQKLTQDHEIERIRTLSQASAEVVISMAGPEQARVIADLKQTEALKGMSDSQVESLMASKSPHFAKALEERWKAIEAGKATEAQRELYERMIAQQAEADLRVEAALRESLDRQDKAADRAQAAAVEAIRSMQQTAQTYAQNQQASTVVVTPGMGMGGGTQVGSAVPPGVGMGQGGTMIICPRCHLQSPVGTKFCQNCGYDFFAAGSAGDAS